MAVPTILWMAARIVPVFTPMATSPTHSDVVTTVLAGLTISLAVLALMGAGLAIWGVQAIKTEAKRTAVRAAGAAARKAFHGEEVQRTI